MKKLLPLIVLIFCSGLYAQTPKEIKKAIKNRDKFLYAVKAPKSFEQSINIEIVNNEILLPVTIQGKTYRFLFDTGATCVLSPELKEQLKLKAVNSGNLQDSAGNISPQDFFIIRSLSIGDIAFTQVGAAAIDLKNFATMLCSSLDGVIGANLMRTCNWRIDYENKKLQFSTKKLLPKTDYTTTDFTEGFSGSPLVTITTGGFYFDALVDTGNNGSIDINEELYFKSRISTSGSFKKSFGKGFYSFTGNKDHTAYNGILDSLYIGKTLVHNQPVRVSPSPMFMIGNEFLAQFGEIVFNWETMQLYLPVATKPLKPETSFGFSPIVNDEIMEVGVIWENSEAQKMGFEVGDKILSINGSDFSTLSNLQWCEVREIFREEKSLDVTILKADGTKKTAQLAKYNLF